MDEMNSGCFVLRGSWIHFLEVSKLILLYAAPGATNAGGGFYLSIASHF